MELPTLSQLSKELKTLITAFVIVLSLGFYSGIRFVQQTESQTPNGVYENYLGNEEQEDAEIYKFKKTPREMTSILHSHIISMALIFFAIGGIVSRTRVQKKLKYFIMIEPFISIVATFGGIYLMWMGFAWMRYIVVFSGILMTFCYTVAVIAILRETMFTKTLKTL